MENNQNEKVSITFEVEKEFIKAVMLVSGISMKDAEEAMKSSTMWLSMKIRFKI